ncbi:MAG TPA: nitrilase-related carbon-nitrogen hydrolase [Elusimicrobiota bacterium]|jgi:NAD+ synthase (glutamine-hydrolysing)|nr:nitrilase-related carbon-nitrogen hydrolase [Elusimicrobiota bacterium]
MKLVRAGAASVNQVPMDWDGNLKRIVAAIDEARRRKVAILCLPELALSGYGCEDAFHAEFVHEASWRSLERLAPRTKGIVVGVGLPVFHDGGLFNAAALLCDGKLLGFAAKKFLAGDGIHYEPRWFKPWPAGVRGRHVRGGKSYPFGEALFDAGGVRLGFEICEDAWVSNRPGGALASRGADVLLNPSASHFAFGKQETRRRFVAEGSRAFGVAYLYANLLGNEAGRVIYDGATLVASEGKIVAQGPRLGFQDGYLTWADVDVSLNRLSRARAASYQPDLAAGEEGLARRPFRFPRLPPGAKPPAAPAWESSPRIKEEEFTRAVSLGLFDYLRKSRARGFVVSLSGGADSSAVATLASHALRSARVELGPAGLAGKLSHVPGLKAAGDALTRRMLACVYQASENSSAESRSAARAVAQAAGAEFAEWDIAPAVKSYCETVSKTLGRKLNWKDDDIALQNIQARVRAPGAWLWANTRYALLLATSDRSEAAVGYATMDGDTSGGLSPIAGIDKAFLLKWLKWMETHGPEGSGPVPALSVVTRQRPTPELRPAAAAQMAEDDLMPYEVLDVFERAFVRDRRSPADILRTALSRFPKTPRARMKEWLARFLRLWCRNQWKRERYAPSFHLDDANLDPRSWCRFPILSSGLEEEIAKL